MIPKFFGIGLGKTGTNSLATAMRILGYRAKHSFTYIDEIYRYEFINDICVASKYEFLDYAFPQARFILTIRDKDKWLGSCESFASFRGGVPDKICIRGIPLRRAEPRFGIFGITYFDREIFSRRYDTFNEEVIDHFKGRENKLLVIDVCNNVSDKLKWKKLCKFVSKGVPDSPFPHRNKKRILNKPIKKIVSNKRITM